MSDKIAILFLGGAKRVSMARYFKQAAAERGLKAEIYSYEIDTHVAISVEAKVIVGLKWSDPKIYDDLHQLAQRHGISIIVPFVDGAVEVAAEMMRRYPDSIFAPCSTPELSRLMFDKVEAAALLEQNGIPIPATYHFGPIDRPLIAKPRRGSASKGLILIDSLADLARVTNQADYLIQQRVDHKTEYTVDCYVSVRDGAIAAIVPRKRIEVSGGEVVRTETVIHPRVYDQAKQALSVLGLRGAVTIQFLHDMDSDRVMLMEINPRLGGGAVCSVVAGVNLPGLIIDDAAARPITYQCYRPYTEIARYPQEVAFYN